MTKGMGRLGKSIREARLRRGLSADEFAEQIGISLKRLAEIEAGEARAGIEILLGAVLVFDIVPDELFGTEKQDPEVARLVENLPRLRQIYRTVRSK